MNKRSLIVMILIGLLGFGMIFGGCDNGTTSGGGSNNGSNNDNGGETTETNVVAEKYRGTWKATISTFTYKIILTENELQNFDLTDDTIHSRKTVFTIDNVLWGSSNKEGTFTTDTNLIFNGKTYTKQP